MVDFVVPVKAPGATSAASDVRQLESAFTGAATKGQLLAGTGPRITRSFGDVRKSAEGAGGGFRKFSGEAGHLGSQLSRLGGLGSHVTHLLHGIGGVSASLGPVGLVIAGITAGLGYLSERSEEAAKKLEKIAEVKKNLAEAKDKRGGLVDSLGGVTSGAGKELGDEERQAIAAGIDPRGVKANATTSAKQALQVATLLANSGLDKGQQKTASDLSNVASRLGKDRVESAKTLIDQLKSSTANPLINGSGGLGFTPNRHQASESERLLDSLGIDPDSQQAKNALGAVHSGLLDQLDANQAVNARGENDKLGAVFDNNGASAIQESLRTHKTAIEDNTKKITDLDKSISDMTTELKKLQGGRGGGWTIQTHGR